MSWVRRRGNRCSSYIEVSNSRLSEMLLTGLVELWQIFMSSSYTSSTHLRLGGSSSLICGLTNRSKATSGTNKLGRGPVELRIAVRISDNERLCVGSMD